MRRANRRDGNHQKIVEAFRKVGCAVADTSMVGNGFPDIAISRCGITKLVEIKDGGKSKSQRALRESQQEFKHRWHDEVLTCETVEQAVALAAIHLPFRYGKVEQLLGMRHPPHRLKPASASLKSAAASGDSHG